MHGVGAGNVGNRDERKEYDGHMNELDTLGAWDSIL